MGPVGDFFELFDTLNSKKKTASDFFMKNPLNQVLPSDLFVSCK